MSALTPWHLVLLLAIILLIVGPGKLPQTGAAVGRTIREFREALQGPPIASFGEPDGTADAPDGRRV